MKKTAIGQTLLIAMLLATSAEARGPNQPIRILPISQATAGAPSNIALAIEDDDIEEIDIATFMVVEERFKTATEFTGATVLDSRQAANAAICARPLPGTACVRRGDTLSLPWPHAVSLAPGLYAELVVVTVIIRGRDEPVDIADYRYFEITADGLFPISGDEYSRRLLPVITLTDGRQVIQGKRPPPWLKKNGSLIKQRGMAARVSLPSSPMPAVIPDNSEINEP